MGLLGEEWESLMLRFCDILSIRNVVEQPVNSRFFHHPAMAVLGWHYYSPCSSCIISLLGIMRQTEAVMVRLGLHRMVVQLGAFGARSPYLRLQTIYNICWSPLRRRSVLGSASVHAACQEAYTIGRG